MNVLFLNGSPSKNGASKYFLRLMRLLLLGCKISEAFIWNPNCYPDVFRRMETVDVVVLAVPLYVDGIPSHVIRFLSEAERFCTETNCRFKLYVISNSGFVEGRQNKSHLEQYRCWCERSGTECGGGLGIGGGVMLRVLSYVILVFAGLFLFEMTRNLMTCNGIVNADMLIGFGRNLLWPLFYSVGMLFCIVRLALAVRREKSIGLLYTRVMLPSFLFLIVADIFMLLSALLNGKLIFSLYKKDDVSSEQRKDYP